MHSLRSALWLRSASVGCVVVAALLLAGPAAHADEEGAPPPPPPKPEKSKEGPRARWHPRYAAEIEAHGLVGAFDRYNVGLGAGVRVSIPVAINAPIKSIDDDISIGIGLDWIRYAAYKPIDVPQRPTVTTVALYVPVFLQWNFWLGSRASMFLEPSVIYRFAEYVGSCSDLPCAPTTRVLPSGAIGFRFRVVDHVAATVRIGWPLTSLGVSWL